MNKPLLSIVIANYNYGRFLEEAIQSVLSQSCDDYELIIVDGGSTDNSVEIIKKYEDKIAWWVSEKDKGQSDAFNKGFAHAKGRLLTWLNADDVMLPGVIAKLKYAAEKHPKCEWFTGNFVRFLSNRKLCEVTWGPNWYPNLFQTRHSPVVSFGPTTFFSKRAFDDVGGFYEDLHYIMDAELWERFILHGIKQRRLRFYCWGFRMHKDSKTAEFGEHNVSDKVACAIKKEKKISLWRSGYKCWRICTFINRVMRVLDGSFIKGCLLRRKFLGKPIDDIFN